MRRRVVITGIGLITCLGADPADQWRRLLAGESGIRALDEPGRPAFRHFAPVDYAAVTLPSSDRKAAKVLTRPSLLALLAAEQALADADGEPAASRRMGIYLGSGEREPESLKTLYPLIRHGRAADGSLDVRLMAADGLRFLNPNCLLSWLPNGSLCQVTIRHGIRGANATLGEDSPNGMDAIGIAFRTIRAGRADVIVCGGTECLADPVVRNSLDVLGLLSACESGRASFRPFDVCRDGYIPGEGAAFVVVEELAQARRRGARISAEIAGFGSGTDTMPGSCGDGIRRAVTRALQDGRAAPDAVETIVAHGSATPAGDAAELRGLRQALGAHAERVPLCAIKPATGYIGSAGDVLQALVAMWVLRDGRLPPILNLTHPDPWSTGFKFVRGTASKADVACALAVSQASVGGQASALLLRRSPYPAPEKEGRKISSYDFRGKIAVVTGGSRGIGRASALELASCGADVAITFYRRHSAARQVVRAIEEMGRRCLAVKADFSEEADIHHLFKVVRAEWGHVDFYVSNAASAFFKPLIDLEPFHWEYVVNTNLTATLVSCREAYQAMPAHQGVIVLVSSLGGRRYLKRYGALGACKAAIESLGRTLAIELAPGVNVNVVCGGIIETESVKAMSEEHDLKLALDRSPMGRLGKPQDLAKVIAFLCSEDAQWIRGQSIVVDGGFSLTA